MGFEWKLIGKVMSMHNNYYFLQHLSEALQAPLEGMELSTCFSQNKDELVLGFSNTKSEFWIRAVLVTNFNLLYFPEDFQRTRKNSVNLFESALGQKVEGIRQFENERCFSVELSNGFSLLFKLFGNRSNVLLFKNGRVHDLFLKKYPNDRNLILDDLNRKIEQTPEQLAALGINKVFPTFGKEIIDYLDTKDYDVSITERKWELIQELLNEFKTPTFYLFSYEEQRPSLLLYTPDETYTFSTKDPIKIANEYFRSLVKVIFLETEKRPAIQKIDKKINQANSYVEKNQKKLYELENITRYEEIGHIIMANLHQIPERSKKIELNDFYNDEAPISIKLNSKLNGQKNAEVYYRKAKNQKIEIQKIKENISSKEDELLMLEMHKESLKPIENVKELRNYLKKNGINQDKAQESILPFKKFKFSEFDILVGKNAKSNDILTQKYAFKEDLWLHARDVPGSHVVIKHKAGKSFPQHVLEKAASLAAYYSQRKNDSLCPVIYTPKKFVRKPKGAAPGAVAIDREEVIMVTPMPPNALIE